MREYENGGKIEGEIKVAIGNGEQVISLEDVVSVEIEKDTITSNLK